jgi:hypothetical protein
MSAFGYATSFLFSVLTKIIKGTTNDLTNKVKSDDSQDLTIERYNYIVLIRNNIDRAITLLIAELAKGIKEDDLQHLHQSTESDHHAARCINSRIGETLYMSKVASSLKIPTEHEDLSENSHP